MAGRGLGTLAVLVLLFSGVQAEFVEVPHEGDRGRAEGTGQTQKPANTEPAEPDSETEPFSKEIVEAWKEAGAKVRWMGIGK